MVGSEVAQQLRRDKFGKGVRLIALTGFGQAEDRQRALTAGIDHCVTKPVDYATLQRLVTLHD
jgi:CheY-like chemotaxis protein